MKNLLKKTYNSIKIVATGIIAALTLMAFTTDMEAQNRVEALDDLSFLEMVNTPDLGSAAETVSKFQMKQGQNLLSRFKNNKDITLELYRNKEVLVVTIPASLLFGPNEIVLDDKASTYLDPIKKFLKDPDMYRVLLAMHTDNTGSEQYRDMLTEERVDAIFDYFDNANVDTRYLFSYALSDDLPIVENNSVLNRAKNRRLEIYLVPGEKMKEQGKKGRIAF